MKQTIKWIEIIWEENAPTNVPHRDYCYFLKARFPDEPEGSIFTGYYQNYDGKWCVIEIEETTVKVPLREFTHFAEVEG